MKKIYLIICLIVGSFSINAQSFSSEDSDVTIYGGFNDQKLSFHTGITNITASSIEGRAYRQNISVISGTVNQICWGDNCYTTGSETIYQTSDTQVIESQETNNSLVAYYLPNGNPGVSQIKYWVENVAGFGDKVIINVTYSATSPSSVNELDRKISLTSAQPNPANDIVTFVYDAKESNGAEFIMVNAIGKIVETIPVDTEGNVAIIDVSNYDAGIYFYQLKTKSGEVTSTQKLVVTH
jgi:hypothetical protein